MAKKNTVKSLQPATAIISEKEVQKYVLDSKEYERIKEQFEALKKSVDAQEKELLAKLQDGAKVDSATYQLSVDRSQTRTNIKWKEAFIARVGQAAADKLAESTPATVYPHIVVNVKVPATVVDAIHS
jgi:hypothetical protein